jgi:hypothetical protein
MQITTIIVALLAAVAMAVPATESVADTALAVQGVYCIKCQKDCRTAAA